jgi:IclR family acetate operon transcriptional repressor
LSPFQQVEYTTSVTPADEDTATGPPNYRIRAVDRVCDLLDALAASNEPIALADLANACQLPKTSAFRYLATLEARRYVERTGDGTDYRLGFGLMALQSSHLETLTEKARPVLERLRDDLEETSNLGLLVGSSVVYLSILESPRSVRLAMRQGDKDAVHCTALGKAIVAQMSEDEVLHLLGTRYERRTDHTAVTWQQLKDELNQVRTVGYAVDDEENEIGGRCVAVHLPLDVRAAISISAPSNRLPQSRVPAVGRQLIDAAQEIATRI